MIERMLPQNIEAECGVLGSIIIDPEVIVQVADFLHPEDFYRDAHRTLYEVIVSLYEHETPADFITICDELERMNKLKSVGGADYITSLINLVPTSGNAEYYAHIIADTGLRRRLIHAGGQIVATAYSREDGQVALEESEQLIYTLHQQQTLTDFSSGGDIFDTWLSRLTEMQHSDTSVVGVPTGFRQLDFITGGLQKTDLIIMAGRPGMGKSSFATSIVYNGVVHDDRCFAIFSLEMSKEQVLQRLVAMDTGINSRRMRTGQIYDEEWERIMDSHKRFPADRLWIDDSADLSIASLRSKARRLYAKCLQAGHPLDCFIVDYVQLMHGSPEYKNNRVLELGEITKGLKNLAKELNVPILALAQLSRAVEQRKVKIPQMSDLRESGSIENDADIVGFIYRDEVYNPNTPRKRIADIILAKHRNGDIGEVALGFQKETTLFYDLDAQVSSLSTMYEGETE